MHPLLGKALQRTGLCFAYCWLFAWIFTLIERNDEPAHQRKERMLSDLRTEINMKYNMTDSDFQTFVRIAAKAVATGDQLDWTLLNSAEFAFAALTTIGYGHITPKTPLGQGITIIFCVFGIPITMLALKTTGELLATTIKFLVLKTETVILKKNEPKHLKKKTFFVACTLMVVLLISTGASAVYFENWTFVEGLYAWFVTFTTIGFGDYVIFESLSRSVDQGEANEDQYVFKSLVLFIPYTAGLCLTSCLLNCVVDSVDEIRDFRDRYMNCWSSLISFARRLFGRKKRSYNVTEEQNTHEIT